MLERLTNRLAPLRRLPPATKTIASLCICVFLIQVLAGRIAFPPGYSFSRILTYGFGFYWPLIAAGAYWQPVTYAFLHGSFVHLALNLFTLVFFGAAVERILGTRRYWMLFLATSVIGGLGWALFDTLEPVFWTKIQVAGYQLSAAASSMAEGWWRTFHVRLSVLFLRLAQRWGEAQVAGVTHNVCVGASAGVFGLVGAFAGLFPRERLMLLLFYVIPVKMQARHLALLLMVVSLFAIIVDNGHVAHVAHIFGGLGGYLYALVLRRRYSRESNG